jgi:hypothetical protein
MARATYFDPLTDKDLLALLRNSAEMGDPRNEEDQSLSIDFMNNKQKTRTDNAIALRYAQRQAKSAGNQIDSVCLPLVDRFLCEAASIYNKPVKRILVDENGEEDEEATKILNDALATSAWDERLHVVERVCVMPGLEACGLWLQAKRGQLVGQVVLPNKIYPVYPLVLFGCDKADQDDYFGFVVELTNEFDKNGQKQFVFLGARQHAYFTASVWSEPHDIKWFDNAIEWPQTIDTVDQRGEIKVLPGQLMVIWRSVLSTDNVLSCGDASLAEINLGLNVQFSILLDTLRKTGWKQLALKLLNPTNPPSQIQMGTGFAIPLGPDEDITSIDLGTNFVGITDTLKTFVKIVAVMHRQSPNDFSVEGQAAISGFAKMIDSIPKLEAREERAKRFKALEEVYAWPRIGAILEYLGKLQNASALRMRVEFSSIEFPLSAQERVQLEEHDLKNNLISPVELIMKKQGLTKEEAENKIEENKEKDQRQQQQDQEDQQPQSKTRLFAEKLIAQKRSGLKEEKTK